jgi:hypothetical protein
MTEFTCWKPAFPCNFRQWKDLGWLAVECWHNASQARLGSHPIQIHARVEVNQLMKLAPPAPLPHSPLQVPEHLLKPVWGI